MTGKPQEGRTVALTPSERVAKWRAKHQRRLDRKKPKRNPYEIDLERVARVDLSAVYRGLSKVGDA